MRNSFSSLGKSVLSGLGKKTLCSVLQSMLVFFGCLLFCYILIAITLKVMPSLPVGLAWDFANYCGFISVAICLILFSYTGKPRWFPSFDGKYFSRLHSRMADLTAFYLLLHIVVLLLDEPILVNYLLPSAPRYMLSGIFSAVIFIIILVTSRSVFRKKMLRPHSRFKEFHYILSIDFMLLVFDPITGSQYYINSFYEELLWAIIFSLFIAFPVVFGAKYKDSYITLFCDRRIKLTAKWPDFQVFCFALSMLIVITYYVLSNIYE